MQIRKKIWKLLETRVVVGGIDYSLYFSNYKLFFHKMYNHNFPYWQVVFLYSFGKKHFSLTKPNSFYKVDKKKKKNKFSSVKRFSYKLIKSNPINKCLLHDWGESLVRTSVCLVMAPLADGM